MTMQKCGRKWNILVSFFEDLSSFYELSYGIVIEQSLIGVKLKDGEENRNNSEA